jgi:hypothetical protein
MITRRRGLLLLLASLWPAASLDAHSEFVAKGQTVSV